MNIPSYEIIAIYGQAGSGKDTLAEVFKHHLPNWQRVGMSDALMREVERRNNLPDRMLDDYEIKAMHRQHLTDLAQELRQVDRFWVIDRALEVGRPLLLIGPRDAADFERLLEHNAYIIRVSADDEIRRQRLGETAWQKTLDNAYEQAVKQFKQHHREIINNGTKDDLHLTVRDLISSL